MSRRSVVVATVLLLAAVGTFLFLRSDEQPAAGLTVDWGGSEGHPGCVYDPESQTVHAMLTIEGRAPRAGTLTVTVTAYADENTSIPVGSEKGSVRVDGTVHTSLAITVPVDEPPHVGEDDVAACSRSVKY